MRIANVVWSFAGLGVPLIVAFLTIPSLIARLGVERFGLLALAWGLIGFAGIFDLGIGRATTQTISRLRGSNQLAQIPAVISIAAKFSLRAGGAGAILLSIAVLAGVQTHIKYGEALSAEVTSAAYLLALAIPIQSMSAMFRGVNEAFENFREISLVRIGLGIANFFGPFCAALITTHLAALVSTLLLSRLIAFFLFRRCAKTYLTGEASTEALTDLSKVSPQIARQLLSFGAWFTVSSVLYPFLAQADRFLIGAVVSAAAVGTYVVPYEIVVQSLILVGAITTVMFPRLSALIGSRPTEGVRAFYRWLMLATTMMLLVSAILAVSLPYLLTLWLRGTLPDGAISVGQILCVGLAPYTVGTMYVALIHAYNRADITGKVNLLEVPIFLAVLYWMTAHHGIQGAAWAWVIRVTLNALLLIISLSLSEDLRRLRASSSVSG